MNKYLICFTLLAFVSCKSSQNGKSSKDGNHKYTNKLINESSPYLLQHAHNPVDWYPWGDEALAKAKAEDKMIIVSVGYAACHWCHVMEHESFEDTLVSKIMNENFICIKVDREERPDIDDVYMSACQLASGRGCGWPLNAFALPDGRPVWASTYFPKKDWLGVLNNFIKIKKEDPERLEESANQLQEGIKQQDNIVLNQEDQDFNPQNLAKIATNFLENIDFKKGGRKGAPKFPMPNNYEFLLNYYHITKDAKALEGVTTTLDNMANGGIYDHLGGGFARYSTDDDWFAPHFEKMLYDNGQLISLYSEAYQLTKNPLYKKVVVETLEYTKREMTNPDGGFYSSLDADSEGEEGKFYVWKKSEIDSLLGDDLAKVFNEFYEVKRSGNWEHKNNILHRKSSNEKVAKKFDLTADQLSKKIDDAKIILMSARGKRIRPGLDDKILTSWNALMLKGYTDAYRAFGNEEYLESAIRNANFLVKNSIKDEHRLNRNFKDGQSVINAFLDDYALLIDAFVHLYQVTFDEQWLNHAKKLTAYTQTHFYDKSTGMFHYTSNLDPELIARKKELADNVIPGSNSTMARNLYKLGTMLYQPEWVDLSKQMLHNLSESITDTPQPNFYSNWCSLYWAIVNPPFEVAVIGDNSRALSKELMQYYLPNALILGGKSEGNLQLLQDKLIEGETRIYVCKNKVCKFPVLEVNKALELME
ncbi:thioredoxin domain-containing protein [bacterium]|nr:thioredoxin domain-containing protein [Saprospiraceae bacterium]MDC3253517.1 thioredoxin domain-containing protein [bacterium]